MPTQQQQQAMNYVDQQIKAGKGADLNANINPFGPNANPQPLNNVASNPTQAPLNGASNQTQTLPNPQKIITPSVQQSQQNPQQQNQQMPRIQGQTPLQLLDSQEEAKNQMQSQGNQSVQMPPNNIPTSNNQQPSQNPQQQGQNQDMSSQQPSQNPQQQNQQSDNTNLQIPQGGFQNQSSAGNFVPQTSGDDGMIQAINQQTGQMEMASPNDPRWATGGLMQNNPSYQMGDSPASNVMDALQGMQGQSFESMMQNAQSQGVDTMGAGLLKQSLMSQLGAIDDPNINKYLDNMASRAQSSYQIGLSMVNKGRDEIDQAIQGTLVSPSTFEGTQAKVLKDTEDLQLQTIDAQRQYQQQQNAIQLDDLQTKRASLEGFLKARMYADGTQDSSAALSVMSQSMHQADMAIASTNSGYTYSQAQLNIQGMQIMHDFGNNISQLVSQTNQKQMQITSDYYGQLNDIDQQALTNEKDKRTQTAAAFGQYYKGMQDLRTDMLNRSFQEQQFAWTKTQDLTKNAFDMSGMTGTVYVPDGKGGYTNTGVQTLAGNQNQFTQWHDTAQLNMAMTAQNWQQMKDKIDIAVQNGIQPGTPAFNDFKHGLEQMAGAPQGTFNGIDSFDGLQDSIGAMGNTAQQQQQQISQVTSLNNVPQSLKDVFNVGGKGGQCGTWASTISTAPRVGNSWNEKLAVVHKFGDIQDNPQPGYKIALPLGINTNGSNSPGHIETVVSYDPQTRNMLTVDANRDLKGTIQMHVENLDQINQKYQSKGWGFIPGQFQPGIQQKLSQLGPQSFQQSTPPEPNVDYFAKALQESGQNGGASSETIKSFANYSLDPSDIDKYLPKNATKIQRDNFINQIKEQNPNWNQAQYKANQQFLTDWVDTGVGKPGYVNASVNKALGQLDTTLQKINANPASGNQYINLGFNTLASQFGFNNSAQVYTASAATVGEMAKAFTGSAPDEATTEAFRNVFNPNANPDQLRQSIKTLAGELGNQVKYNIESYRDTIGTLPQNTLKSDAIKAMKDMNLNPSDYDPSYKENDQNNQPFIQNKNGGQTNNVAFKIQSAAKAGYSPQDILTYLQKDPQYSSKIQMAIQQGYKPEDIFAYFNK